ncbi:hypothetical protein TYRP_005724 [Tyrophagus putrescentiae]|nr:hypothetical protein TYRP_005724 [Tyrophagus putrescentiae]
MMDRSDHSAALNHRPTAVTSATQSQSRSEHPGSDLNQMGINNNSNSKKIGGQPKKKALMT